MSNICTTQTLQTREANKMDKQKDKQISKLAEIANDRNTEAIVYSNKYYDELFGRKHDKEVIEKTTTALHQARKVIKIHEENTESLVSKIKEMKIRETQSKREEVNLIQNHKSLTITKEEEKKRDEQVMRNVRETLAKIPLEFREPAKINIDDL